MMHSSMIFASKALATDVADPLVPFYLVVLIPAKLRAVIVQRPSVALDIGPNEAI